MAVQTKLFNLFNNLGNLRQFSPFLSNNRFAFNFVQPAAGVSTETKNKLKALPEKPKKPPTPFIRYSIERRPDILKKHPTAKVGEIAKILGEEWKKVGEDVKKKYEKKYKDEMDVYTKEHLEYLANLTEEQKQLINDAAKEKKHVQEARKLRQFYKDSNKPKRVKTPYMWYMTEQMAGTKGGLKQALVEFKGKWAELTEAEKQKYIQMAEDDKKRYEMEMNAWEAKMIKEGRTDVIRKSTLDDHKPRHGRKKVSEKEESK